MLPWHLFASCFHLTPKYIIFGEKNISEKKTFLSEQNVFFAPIPPFIVFGDVKVHFQHCMTLILLVDSPSRHWVALFRCGLACRREFLAREGGINGTFGGFA